MIRGWKDKILFTPGPLTTSQTVKLAMLRDLGSRDFEFIEAIKDIRRRLVAIGQASLDEYTAIPMQGSGTFGLEAVVASVVPEGGKLLVVRNGAYGKRMVHLASVLKIPVVEIATPEDKRPRVEDVASALDRDPAITHVAMVHCETTSGIINPVEAVGQAVAQRGRQYIVDAMSSFGAVPLALGSAHIDYLISSANKCIEGVPGFCFVVARIGSLEATVGRARSVSFDIHAQWRGLEENGQFRFTPPTHALLAFRQALVELEEEGGVVGRAARYRQNYETLVAGMRDLGFEEFLQAADQGYIITSFRCPKHPKFSFEQFYKSLGERNYVIYPGKVGDADCFRIGSIGRVFASDVRDLLGAIRETLDQLGVELKRGA